jgi:hypothetical protein
MSVDFQNVNYKGIQMKAVKFQGQHNIKGLRRFCSQWMLVDPKHGHSRVNNNDYLVDFGGVLKVFTRDQFFKLFEVIDGNE